MKVALVCIAKNEDNYIQEWIDYHIKLGFDRIFIYQNEWRWNGEHQDVQKIEFDGVGAQKAAYNHFISENHNTYKWAAFFDVDEFLVLKKHKDVKSFLTDYDNFDAVGVSWRIFGSNGLSGVTDNEYSLIKRFTKREISNQHIKSIIKLEKKPTMKIHNSDLKWVDTNGVLRSGPFSDNPLYDVAQLNHYYTKTYEEFEKKCLRGRASTGSKKRNPSEFFIYENFTNEIEDLNAYNFMYNVNNNLLNT